jgi:hypothetical protein
VNEPYDKLEAIVFGLDHPNASRATLFAQLSDEMRLAKAGALYADELIVAGQATAIATRDMDEAIALGDDEAIGLHMMELLDSMDEPARAGFMALMDALEHRSIKTASNLGTVMLLAQWADGALAPDLIPLASERSIRAAQPEAMDRNLVELLRGPEGQGLIDEWEIAIADQLDDAALRERFEGEIAEMKRIRAGAEPNWNRPPPPRTRSTEAALLSGVLGGLPAFPDADWDVILDVRERLGASRVNFRAAIATAAEELKDCDDPEELGAVPTLLRVTQEAPTVGAIVTNLALVAGNPAGLGLSAAAHALASAPVIASAVREAAHQRQARRELAARPFWLLREIDQKSR